MKLLIAVSAVAFCIVLFTLGVRLGWLLYRDALIAAHWEKMDNEDEEDEEEEKPETSNKEYQSILKD